MNYVNFDDALGQITALGIDIDLNKIRVNGGIQRWKTADSKGNEKPGWTILKEWQSKAGNLYLVGTFGVWSGNDDGKQRIELPKQDDSVSTRLTAQDIEAMREAQKAQQKALDEIRKREEKTAASWAARVWTGCMPAFEHEYLTRKGISPNGTRVLTSIDGIELDGVDESNAWRLAKSVGALVVPMHDANGNVCGLQFIFPDGHEFKGKQFWPTGMGMGGTFGLIGDIRRNGILLIAEGFATAGSLHESTGQSVAYAFSANNLIKAGKQIRAKYSGLKILFCADDDYVTEQKSGKNPGIDSAQKAASSIEFAAWTKPDFKREDGTDLRDGKKLSDFNDLAILTGLPIVLANQINAKLDELKWRERAPATADATKQGGGDDRRCAVSIMPVDELVERFVHIDDQTGDYVFDQWTREICKFSKMIKLLPAGRRGDDVKSHPVWQKSAVYIDQIGFDPSEADTRIACNLWRGWPTKPKKGRCYKLLNLIHSLCANEDANSDKPGSVFEWLIKWMAYPIQNAGAKMISAVVVHGPQGTGKSMAFEALARIYGEYSIVINQAAIEDKFNDWMSKKCFVVADEVVAKADMYHIKNQLKNLITCPTVRINPKGVASHVEANHMNFIFLSNEKMPVVLEDTDRRHCVIWTPPQEDILKEHGADFFTEVWKEIEEGGIEAFHHYLKYEVDLTGFHWSTKPPMTKAKSDLIDMSCGSDEMFVKEWKSGFIDGLPFCPISSDVLYKEYRSWCSERGEPFPRSAKQFLATASKPGWRVYRPDRYVDLLPDTRKTISFRCVVPPENEVSRAGAFFDEGDLSKRPEENTTKWLTRCWFAVENSLRKRGEK